MNIVELRLSKLIGTAPRSKTEKFECWEFF